MPGPGPGSTWWMIDDLGFDQQFLAALSLIGATLTLAGMFIFRRFMAERSIAYIIGLLTVVGTLLSLPTIGMYYGLHHWTASVTGGFVDARFIAVIDTALESPLGQIAMIPMLAWIANSAPEKLKATFFAVMASFTNLALSASQLGTKYMNEIFVVTREVKDADTGQITVPADYSELGLLLILGHCDRPRAAAGSDPARQAHTLPKCIKRAFMIGSKTDIGSETSLCPVSYVVSCALFPVSALCSLCLAPLHQAGRIP